MMGNSIFNSMNQGNMGNPGNISKLQMFNMFRSQLTGDPKQKVMELLNTGKMSNAQFQQLQSQATQFQQMFGIK